MSLYNVTQDLHFLNEAYRAFSLNNDALYAARMEPSGLCTWAGWSTGWDTSPRWDHGDVQAIDLNSWLHLDQLLLAQVRGPCNIRREGRAIPCKIRRKRRRSLVILFIFADGDHSQAAGE